MRVTTDFLINLIQRTTVFKRMMVLLAMLYLAGHPGPLYSVLEFTMNWRAQNSCEAINRYVESTARQWTSTPRHEVECPKIELTPP